jgi:hypothetical protein
MNEVNYSEAARRHYYDANLLSSNSRAPNAGQLYGLVAECGLKSLLVSYGCPVDPEGSVKDRKKYSHVDALCRNFLDISSFLSGRSAARYLAMVPSFNSFTTWKVSHRYFAASAIPSSLPQWSSAATEVMQMLDQALLDGVIL